MSQFRVGIIGCGRPLRTEGATGFGMSNWHAKAYEQSPDCEIVALADISTENALAFQQEHGGEHIYTDYHEMLKMERPDIVSVCTWPGLHAEMVIAAAETGAKGIYCEKPMAPTFGEAKKMLEACERNGTVLCINHQRRFLPQFLEARKLLRSGTIGKLIRMEMATINLFDWGTHWFDMMFFYNDETPAQWVLGQIEPTGGKSVFGVMQEGQGLSLVRFENDVTGLVITGQEHGWEAQNRLIGEEGVIEVRPRDGSLLRYWNEKCAGWQVAELTPHQGRDLEMTVPGIMDMIECIKTSREPVLSGRKALQATELIFATYESSRKHGRVDLPLQIEDSPLQTILTTTGVL